MATESHVKLPRTPCLLALLLPSLLACPRPGESSSSSSSSSSGGATSGPSPSSQAGSSSGGSQGSSSLPGSSSSPPSSSGARVSGVFRINHVGWTPQAPKTAVLLGHAGATVEARRAADHSVAATFTASSPLRTDEDSQDACATVDLSSLSQPGEYYLFMPQEGLRSPNFLVAADAYNIVGAAAVKSYYFQRCNSEKVLPYATDVLGSFAGLGGRWVDGTCHAGDETAPAGPGSPDHGPLDVRGGWHDAGDYQKTLWGRGVPEMLFAYEVNPTAWTDGQLHIPESGNGVPDLLDEVAWELDFYLRMQRPDGHFLTSAKGHNSTINSPPSASDEERVYFDGTSPDGNGWSGGGVTTAQATANAVMCLAHAALVFAQAGATTPAAAYRAAALSGWQWLSSRNPSVDGERRARVAAAAATFRLDPTQGAARDVVEAVDWGTWDGTLGSSLTPSESVLATAAWHHLQNPMATAAVKDTVRQAVGDGFVDAAFSEEGAYGGMFGGPGNGWEWSWGSNRNQSSSGANLMMAARLGITGSHTRDEVEQRARKHFHFMLGLNPLNMVFLTNMAAYGAEHSSFQIYHAWFSYTGGDGEHGNAQYNGKPAAAQEPLYPYHPDDTQTSTHGPAPGLVPGGPNFYYGATYDIPNRANPAYAYRDFSVGCDWDGSQCLAASWEITEPMAAYQGPFVMLASFMMTPP